MKKTFINLIRSVSLAALVVAVPLYAMENGDQETAKGVVASASTQASFLKCPQSPEFQSFLQTFRADVAEYEKEETSFLARPSQDVMFLMEDIVGYVNSLPESFQKEGLQHTLDLHKKAGKISPAILLGVYFKAAHLRGAPSEDEKEVFKHAVAGMDETTKSLIDGLSDPDSWEHLMTFFFWQRSFAGKNEFFIYLNHADYNIISEIEDTLDALYPVPLFLPVVKEGKFPIPFMIESNLDNVYPMAFGKKSIKAHGVNVTTVGLAFHDLIHGLSTTAYNAMKTHLIKKTDEAVGRGEDAETFIKAYAPEVMAKYKELMEDLKGVYGFIKMLPEPEKKPALAGFFWMLHEASPFEASRTVDCDFPGPDDIFPRQDDIFDVNSLEEKLVMLVRESKNILSDSESWESPVDSLTTSPLTGESLLSNPEITDKAYAQLPPQGEKDRATIKSTLKKSLQFIDVTLSERKGRKQTVYFATLAHKWRNVDDSLAVLKYAGKVLTKPDLTAIEGSGEQREVAMAFLGKVQTELSGLLDSFQEKALLSLKQEGEVGASS